MNSSEMTRLTHDGRIKSDPVFVDKGEAIVYTVQETAAQLSLMKLKLADKTPVRFHPDATTSEFEAAFAPDESRYAFVHSRGQSESRHGDSRFEERQGWRLRSGRRFRQFSPARFYP